MQTWSSVRHGVNYYETNLVVQSARTFLSGADDGGLQTALSQAFGWEGVERKANYHSVMPLVAYALKTHGGVLVPQELREEFRQRLLLTARTNMLWLQEWRRILLAFEAARISVISLKGPAFALLAYGNIALREFTDLDLLVKPGDVLNARDALLGKDYRLGFPLAVDTDETLLRSGNRQLDFVNDERGTLIDLHWGVLHEMFSFQLPVDQLFESAQVEHVEGISFLSLSPEHLLLYLCAHGTKHCWLNLRWLCDVACHVRAVRGLDWDVCIHSATEANYDLVLKHTLLLAQQVLGLDLPSAVRSYCDAANARALADTARSFLFRDGGHLGYGEALRYHLAFAKGWRDRGRLVHERVFVPAEPDWQEVRLPRSLHFLYYAVRPARFLFERLSNTALRSEFEDGSAKTQH